jgi:DNA-binding beta-propeller fold protein YncE
MQPANDTEDAAPSDRGLIAVDKVANKIRFYDPRTLREIKVIDSPEPTVHELALACDRNRAFVPLYGDGIYGNNKNPNNKILVIDLARQAICDIINLGLFVAPHGMVATRDGKLWVVCDLPNRLLCIDLAQRAIEDVYACPAKGPHLIETLPDQSRLYISAKEGDLAVFDPVERMFIAAVPMGVPGIESGNGGGSEGLTPTPDGQRLLVIDNDRTVLRVIDTAIDCEIDRVTLKPHVFSNPKRSRLAKLMFSRDGRYLVVTSYATGLAWVLDASDYRVQAPVPVAKGPMGIAFPTDGTSVIIASHDSGLLTRVDLAAGRAMTAVDGGGGIEVMAFF